MRPVPSDARLARRASDGDEHAFAAIFRRYHQELYRFCLSIVSRPEDAQEALQNTMVKALRSLPGEEREIRLKPWLYRVAHNESIDLLRRRREGPDIDTVQASAAAEIADTVELRARLSRLLADLAELPDRQRSALTMRELGGLSYEQIGEAFGTSVAVARQTVYEARLGLRELEAGREMRCEEVTRQLSDADGRVLRRRDIQAHLRSCADCRAFRDAIPRRRDDLAALAPLPAVAAAAILHGAGGSAAAGGIGGGTSTAAVGVGAGKAAATSVALKAVATVAVAATIGATVADRGGVVDLGLPGGGSGQSRAGADGAAGGSDGSGAATTSSAARDRIGRAAAARRRRTGVGGALEFNPAPRRSHDSLRPGTAPSAGLPPASSHGQETAAAHRDRNGHASGRGAAAAHHASKGSGRSHRHTSPGRSQAAHGKRQGHPPPGTGAPAEPGKGSGKPKASPEPPTEASSPTAPPPAAKPAESQPSGNAAEKGDVEDEAAP